MSKAWTKTMLFSLLIAVITTGVLAILEYIFGLKTLFMATLILVIIAGLGVLAKQISE